MSNVFHPITPAFRNALAACTVDERGALVFPSEPPLTLHVRVGESGAWSVGTSGAGAFTIDEASRAEIATALRVLSEGTYLRASDGAERALYATDAGSALPSGPPGPPT